MRSPVIAAAAAQTLPAMTGLSASRAAAALFVVAFLGSGCTVGAGGILLPPQQRPVGAHRPAPPVHSVHLYHRADRDARTYTRQVARAVRLSAYQQRVIHDIVSHRAFDLLDRTHPRDLRYVYPFPRRAYEHERLARRFWREVDREIERVLNPHQRRAYREFVRYHFAGWARDPWGHRR